MPEPKNAEDILEAELVFHEQADGRLVAKIAGGKAVLLDTNEFGRVKDGQKWRVRLHHRETFAIATLIKPCSDNPVLSPVLGEALRASIPAAGPAPKGIGAKPVDPASTDAPPSAGGRDPAPETRLGPAGPSFAARSATRIGPQVPEVLDAGRPTANAPMDPRRVIHPTDRVALFVDGANMDGACRAAGYFIDYGKAREFFQAGGLFYAGYFYIADFTNHDPQQIRFLDFLAQAGFIVRRRPVKIIYDEDTGERIMKCNLDTEIVLDMLNAVDNYDVAYLFSGDSDFERAVDLLRSRGKRVYVVTASHQLSRELMYAADKPIFYIEDYRPLLLREGRQYEPKA